MLFVCKICSQYLFLCNWSLYLLCNDLFCTHMKYSPILISWDLVRYVVICMMSWYHVLSYYVLIDSEVDASYFMWYCQICVYTAMQPKALKLILWRELISHKMKWKIPLWHLLIHYDVCQSHWHGNKEWRKMLQVWRQPVRHALVFYFSMVFLVGQNYQKYDIGPWHCMVIWHMCALWNYDVTWYNTI